MAFISGHKPETAKALLEAAEELGYDVYVVKTVQDGFDVPEDVLEKAFPVKGEAHEEAEDEAKEESKPATKTAAKTASAKK